MSNAERRPLTVFLASIALVLAGTALIAAPAQANTPVVVNTLLEMKPLLLGNPNCTDVELGQDINTPGGTLAVACDAVIDLNGHTLTLAHIKISAGKTLTIRATGGGALKATSDAENFAAIETTGATLVIEGGDITAKGGTETGAGIGGSGVGGGTGADGGTVTIKGGMVTASGGDSAAGIGGGGYLAGGGTINISGGTINATGGIYGAGIGGGYYGDGGTINISGGTVTASGGSGSAGIGGGNMGAGGTINISDGTVHAASPNLGAAIGGGGGGNGGTITIAGGTVDATAENTGAGIGGGGNSDGGSITINGGTVTANAGDYGAAIGGGGSTGDGGTITINGGTVTAQGDGRGAAIGGGSSGDGGTVDIAGGTVIANNNGIGVPGIGGGYSGVLGTLSIGEGADVTARGYHVIGSGEISGSAASTFSVAGTLRIPVNNSLWINTGNTLTVAATGVISGLSGEADTGVIRGLGTVENAGSITLPTSKVGAPVPSIKDHQYTVSFDGQGGSDPETVKVFAKSFTDGARTLPTPTRPGYGFGGWYTEANGGGTKIEAATTLPGSSDGTPVAISLYAKWSLSSPTLTGDSTAAGQVGSEFTYTPTLDASPGTTVTLTAGTLPSGLSLDTTTGAITGKPSVGSGGTYPITLTADNDVDPNATLDVTITITEAPTLTGASAATGVEAQAFAYTPTAVGGFPAPTVTVTAGALPAGLSLNSTTGAITGTPSAGTGGTYPITLQAYNGIITIATLDVTITITSDHVLGLTPTITGLAQVGQTLTAHEGPVVPSDAFLSYVWKANGNPIANATGPTYKLKAAQAGKTITVTITASKPPLKAVTETSDPTPYVREKVDGPELNLDRSSASRGGSLGLLGKGLTPGAVYRVAIGGTSLGSFIADEYGEINQTTTVPGNTRTGIQIATITSPGGKVTSTVLIVT